MDAKDKKELPHLSETFRTGKLGDHVDVLKFVLASGYRDGDPLGDFESNTSRTKLLVYANKSFKKDLMANIDPVDQTHARFMVRCFYDYAQIAELGPFSFHEALTIASMFVGFKYVATDHVEMTKE